MSNSSKNDQENGVSPSPSPPSRPVSQGNKNADIEPDPKHETDKVDSDREDPYHAELQRELPLESTFDKNRTFVDSGSNQRRRLFEQRGSLSMSQSVAEDDDHPSKNIMEEKSIVGEGNAEEGNADDQPKDQDQDPIQDQTPKSIKPIEKRKTVEAIKDQSDDDDDDDDDDDQDSHQMPAEGLYDPNEFINLPVGSDVKELFQFISAYTPQVIEIDTILKPFILDYIPAVGDIDAFIKIPRPDDVEDNLGLLVLDEPCAKQSDPSVLDLHLRAASKDTLPKGTVVKKLARADRNPKEIENWIKSIGELHKSKPATQVHYSKPMPDIDVLMQEWPPEVEETLKQIDLPSADLELMPLEQYVDAACALLDVPVYKSRIQSLHVLFTLYSEFKNSQHFRALAEENRVENATNAPRKDADRLVL